MDRYIFTFKVAQSCLILCDPWTIQSMEFSRTEYCIGYPLPSPGDLPNSRIEPRCPALRVVTLPAELSGKPKNTGVGSLSLVQRIFLTQELNQGLLHCRWIFYQLSCEGGIIPIIFYKNNPSWSRAFQTLNCHRGQP